MSKYEERVKFYLCLKELFRYAVWFGGLYAISRPMYLKLVDIKFQSIHKKIDGGKVYFLDREEK